MGPTGPQAGAARWLRKRGSIGHADVGFAVVLMTSPRKRAAQIWFKKEVFEDEEWMRDPVILSLRLRLEIYVYTGQWCTRRQQQEAESQTKFED